MLVGIIYKILTDPCSWVWWFKTCQVENPTTDRKPNDRSKNQRQVENPMAGRKPNDRSKTQLQIETPTTGRKPNDMSKPQRHVET